MYVLNSIIKWTGFPYGTFDSLEAVTERVRQSVLFVYDQDLTLTIRRFRNLHDGHSLVVFSVPGKDHHYYCEEFSPTLTPVEELEKNLDRALETGAGWVLDGEDA